MSDLMESSSGQKKSSRLFEASTRDSREQILLAATQLFAEKGFEATTVKELAQAADLNVSLISYYFGGKDGLYKAVLERFARGRVVAIQRLLAPAESREEFRVKLKLWVTEFLETTIQEKDVTTIIFRDFDPHNPLMMEVFRDHFRVVFETLVAYFAAAKEAGYIKAESDPLVLAGMIHGTLMHFCSFDRLGCQTYGRSLEDPAYRKQFAEHLLEIHLNGMLRVQN